MTTEPIVAAGWFRDVPLQFGTDDCRANSDYALTSSDYVVSLYLEGFGRADDVNISVVE